MKAALAVKGVCSDPSENLHRLKRLAQLGARRGGEIVLFPEMALTAGEISGRGEEDLSLGQPVPGPMTDSLSSLAADLEVHLAVGLLERSDRRLYDTALLFAPSGELALFYRRIQPQWHADDVDASVYCEGEEVPSATTPFGSLAFVICGDIFEDRVVETVQALHPDLVLFPLARWFKDRTGWRTEELPVYCNQVRRIGSPALMVNELDSHSPDIPPSLGGAYVVSAAGRVLAASPLDQQGVLCVDISLRRSPEAVVSSDWLACAC